MSELTIGDSMKAHFQRPEGPGPYPGVVVLHELWGLNDDIRSIVGRFAAAGYAAVAPDLYSPGLKPLCIARTLKAMATEGAGPVDAADAARSWLASRPEVDAGRIGAIGFCMGGGFALSLGARGDLCAVSVNYGAAPRDESKLANVCPVIGSYGKNDKTFAKEGARLEAILTGLGVTHDISFYDGAAHSFMNDAGHPVLRRALRPVMAFGYQPAAAAAAWPKVLAFFDEHVRDAG